jgi:hypothetical protein
MSAVLLLTALAGCGLWEDEASEVVDAVRDYQDAFLNSDARAACERLTEEAKRQLVVQAALRGPARSCEGSIRFALDRATEGELDQLRRSRDSLQPEDVRLRDSRASIPLSAGRSMTLRKVDGRWLISDPRGHSGSRRDRAAGPS